MLFNSSFSRPSVRWVSNEGRSGIIDVMLKICSSSSLVMQVIMLGHKFYMSSDEFKVTFTEIFVLFLLVHGYKITETLSFWDAFRISHKFPEMDKWKTL